MIGFALSEISEALNARHLGANVRFSAVSTDSRRIAPGELFVALKGPRFDGHDYLLDVRERGAVAAMVSHETDVDLPSLLVNDTRVGLGRLAAIWREASGVPLVAITGSNGKTTVKEMVAAMLSAKGSVLATEGNLNNDIGLPLTLLRLQNEAYAVVELGANHTGEIDYLSRIARPDVALVNNAGRAHLEGFGSVEQVAHAKGEIANGLKPEGCFIFNLDDPMAAVWQALANGRRTLTFGVAAEADVRLLEQSDRLEWGADGFVNRFSVATPEGEIDIRMRLAGHHNRLNALAAIAAVLPFAVTAGEIRQGLASLQPVPGRLQYRTNARGLALVDDSYNANPESVSAAIDVLASAPGRRFLALGALAELGDERDLFYRELGELARARGIDGLYAVGEAVQAAAAFGQGGQGFDSNEALIAGLCRELRAGDALLVKGSRRAGMEQVVAGLINGESL